MMLQIAIRYLYSQDQLTVDSGNELNGIHDEVSLIGAREIKYTGRVREVIEDGVYTTLIIALVNVGGGKRRIITLVRLPINLTNEIHYFMSLSERF